MGIKSINKRKKNIFFQCTAVLLAAIFVFTGCQGKSQKYEDHDDQSDSEIVSGAVENDLGVVPVLNADLALKFFNQAVGSILGKEDIVLVFTDYGGALNPISVTDTTVKITLHSQKDMEKLAKLTWIKELDLSGSQDCPITNAECIKNLTQLESLRIHYEDVTDISALSGLTNLKSLNLDGNKIKDISALSGLTNLKDLSLANNNIQDISPIANFKALEELGLQSNRIENLSPLSDLENLRFLGLDNNPVKDLTPLSGLDKQAYVSFRGNNLAWDAWEPINHLDEVPGRPPVVDAGTTPCPQAWVDRIYDKYPEETIISLDYDDYDGNGTYEAFAFVSVNPSPYGADFWYEGALLMITDNSLQELKRTQECNIGGYCRFGDTKIIFLADSNGFTSSTSYIWTADGKKPRSMNLSGWGQWFYVDEFGNVCVLDSSYDGSSEHMGHSYKPYFFYFDGWNFVEYGAIPITEEEFLRCGGAEEVLEEIEEEGLTLTNILYRGNGMIHINLRKYAEETSQDEESKENDTRYYDNKYKTFHLSDDGQLELVDSDMGVYYEYKTGTGGTAMGISFETVPVEYPSCFPLQ